MRFFKNARNLVLITSLITLMGLHATIAGPTGSQVIQGSVDIVHNGNQTTIYQHTNQAILQHTNFDIGAAETVQFVQPNASASALNRIMSAQPTVIDGQLLANGRVFLINPAGIIFGESAYVNTTQLVASALNLSNENFLAGNYHFQGGAGAVINEGTITATESTVLIGKRVKNHGHIECPQGYVLMAAGDEVFMAEPGSPVVVAMETENLVTSGLEKEATVENSGSILAPGGEIALAAAGDMYGMAILNSGQLDTSSETVGGAVTLAAGTGTALHTGSIAARSTTEQGGKVQLTGERVGVLESGSIDVSGATGGGEVLVGGDYQGRGDVPTASRTVVDEQATIIADATDQGDGGEVIVWADETTYFAGSISARGGASGGDGGFVEVSGKENLGFEGQVDAQAPQGNTGTLLLDPVDIIVSNDTGPPSDGHGGGTILFDDVPVNGEPWNVMPGDLSNAESNILLQADQDITFDSAVNLGGTYSLTAQAGRSVLVNANLTAAGGVSLTANETVANGVNDGNRGAGDAVITMADGTALSGGSGDVTLRMSTGPTTNNGSGDITIRNLTTLGNILIENNGSGTVSAAGDISTAQGNGNININSTVTTTGAWTMNSGSGDITVTGQINTGANGFTIYDSGVTTLTGGIAGSTADIDIDAATRTDVDGAIALTGAGTVNIERPVISGVNISTGGGTVTLNGTSATDSGAVTISTSNGNVNSGALTLGGDFTVNAGSGTVIFNDTVNDDGSDNTSSDLAVNTTGTTRFQNAIGGTAPVESLTTNAGGTTYLRGSVTTDGGTQTYNDALILQGFFGTTLTDTGTTGITFNSTVDAYYEGNVSMKVVTTNSQATIAFNDDVGATEVTNLTITNAGLLDIAPGADISLRGAFLQNGSGAVQTAGDITSGNGGSIDFTGPVTLTDAHAIRLDSSDGDAGGNIIFRSTLDGTTAHAEDLTLTAGSGNVTFSGVVGGTTALGDVTVTSATDVTFSAAFNADNISITASDSTIDVNDTVTAAGNLSFFNNTTVVDGGALVAGNNILFGFGKTVTGAGDLTMNAGGTISAVDSGNVNIVMAADGSTLSLTQGGTLDLSTFTVTNDEDTDLVFSITGGGISATAAGAWRSLRGSATGNIDLRESTSADVVLGGDITSSGGGVRLQADLGRIYTYGNTAFALNNTVTGTSNDNSSVGVGLSGSGLGAVVIRSGGNFHLGSVGGLVANGTYYSSSVDDRSALNVAGGSAIDAAVLVVGNRVTIDPSATISAPSGAATVIDSTSGTTLGSPPASPWSGLGGITSSERLEIIIRGASSLGDTSVTIPYASEVAAGVAPAGLVAGTYVLRGGSSGVVLGSVEGAAAVIPPIATYFDVAQVVKRDPLLQKRKKSTTSNPMVINPPSLLKNWQILKVSAETILGRPLKIPHIQCMEDSNDLQKYACIELDKLWASDVDDIAPVFIERIAHRIVNLYSQLNQDFDKSRGQLLLVANSWQEWAQLASREEIDVVGRVNALIADEKNKECKQWLDAAVSYAQTLYLQQGFTIDSSVQKVQETCVAEANIQDLINAYIRYRLLS